MKRRIKQIAIVLYDEQLIEYALCNDGTVWFKQPFDHDKIAHEWSMDKPIPQPKEKPDRTSTT